MGNKKWKWEKARVIYLWLCPVQVPLGWLAVTHLSAPLNEISIFLLFTLYMATVLFIEAKAGTEALKAQSQHNNLPPPLQ